MRHDIMINIDKFKIFVKKQHLILKNIFGEYITKKIISKFKKT